MAKLEQPALLLDEQALPGLSQGTTEGLVGSPGPGGSGASPVPNAALGIGTSPAPAGVQGSQAQAPGASSTVRAIRSGAAAGKAIGIGTQPPTVAPGAAPLGIGRKPDPGTSPATSPPPNEGAPPSRSPVPGVRTDNRYASAALKGYVHGVTDHMSPDGEDGALRERWRQDPHRYAGDMVIYANDRSRYRQLEGRNMLPSQRWSMLHERGLLEDRVRGVYQNDGDRLEERHGLRPLAERVVLGLGAITDHESEIERSIDGIRQRPWFPARAGFRQLVLGFRAPQLARVAAAFREGPERAVEVYRDVFLEYQGERRERRRMLLEQLLRTWDASPEVLVVFERVTRNWSPNQKEMLRLALQNDERAAEVYAEIEAQNEAMEAAAYQAALARFAHEWDALRAASVQTPLQEGVMPSPAARAGGLPWEVDAGPLRLVPDDKRVTDEEDEHTDKDAESGDVAPPVAPTPAPKAPTLTLVKPLPGDKIGVLTLGMPQRGQPLGIAPPPSASTPLGIGGPSTPKPATAPVVASVPVVAVAVAPGPIPARVFAGPPKPAIMIAGDGHAQFEGLARGLGKIRFRELGERWGQHPWEVHKHLFKASLDEVQSDREGRFISIAKMLGCDPSGACTIDRNACEMFNALLIDYTPEQRHRVCDALTNRCDAPLAVFRACEAENAHDHMRWVEPAFIDYEGERGRVDWPNPVHFWIAAHALGHAVRDDAGDVLSDLGSALGGMFGGGAPAGIDANKIATIAREAAPYVQKGLDFLKGGMQPQRAMATTSGPDAIPALPDLGPLAQVAQGALGVLQSRYPAAPQGQAALGVIQNLPDVLDAWTGRAPKDFAAKIVAGLASLGLPDLASQRPEDLLRLIPRGIPKSGDPTTWWTALTSDQGLSPAIQKGLGNLISSVSPAKADAVIGAYRQVLQNASDAMHTDRVAMFTRIVNAARATLGSKFDPTKLAANPFALLAMNMGPHWAPVLEAIKAGGDAISVFDTHDQQANAERMGHAQAIMGQFLQSLWKRGRGAPIPLRTYRFASVSPTAMVDFARQAGVGADAIPALQAANPGVNLAALKPGAVINIPASFPNRPALYGGPGPSSDAGFAGSGDTGKPFAPTNDQLIEYLPRVLASLGEVPGLRKLQRALAGQMVPDLTPSQQKVVDIVNGVVEDPDDRQMITQGYALIGRAPGGDALILALQGDQNAKSTLTPFAKRVFAALNGTLPPGSDTSFVLTAWTGEAGAVRTNAQRLNLARDAGDPQTDYTRRSLQAEVAAARRALQSATGIDAVDAQNRLRNAEDALTSFNARTNPDTGASDAQPAGPMTVRPEPMFHLTFPPMTPEALARMVKIVPSLQGDPPGVVAEMASLRGQATDVEGVDATTGEYVCEPGETYEQIADKLVGDPGRARELRAANPDHHPGSARLRLPPSWFSFVHYAGPAQMAAPASETGYGGIGGSGTTISVPRGRGFGGYGGVRPIEFDNRRAIGMRPDWRARGWVRDWAFRRPRGEWIEWVDGAVLLAGISTRGNGAEIWDGFQWVPNVDLDAVCNDGDTGLTGSGFRGFGRPDPDCRPEDGDTGMPGPWGHPGFGAYRGSGGAIGSGRFYTPSRDWDDSRAYMWGYAPPMDRPVDWCGEMPFRDAGGLSEASGVGDVLAAIFTGGLSTIPALARAAAPQQHLEWRQRYGVRFWEHPEWQQNWRAWHGAEFYEHPEFRRFVGLRFDVRGPGSDAGSSVPLLQRGGARYGAPWGHEGLWGRAGRLGHWGPHHEDLWGREHRWGRRHVARDTGYGYGGGPSVRLPYGRFGGWSRAVDSLGDVGSIRLPMGQFGGWSRDVGDAAGPHGHGGGGHGWGHGHGWGRWRGGGGWLPYYDYGYGGWGPDDLDWDDDDTGGGAGLSIGPEATPAESQALRDRADRIVAKWDATATSDTGGMFWRLGGGHGEAWRMRGKRIDRWRGQEGGIGPGSLAVTTNIFDRPSDSAPSLGVLPAGTPLRIVERCRGRGGSWTFVLPTLGGPAGWVFAEVVNEGADGVDTSCPFGMTVRDALNRLFDDPTDRAACECALLELCRNPWLLRRLLDGEAINGVSLDHLCGAAEDTGAVQRKKPKKKPSKKKPAAGKRPAGRAGGALGGGLSGGGGGIGIGDGGGDTNVNITSDQDEDEDDDKDGIVTKTVTKTTSGLDGLRLSGLDSGDVMDVTAPDEGLWSDLKDAMGVETGAPTRTYAASEGDTPKSIAQRYDALSRPRWAAELKDANPSYVWAHVQSGDPINIPSEWPQPFWKGIDTGDDTGAMGATRRTYVVQPGDKENITALAGRAGVGLMNLGELQAANPGKGAGNINPGDVINIPDSWPERPGMYQNRATPAPAAPPPTATRAAPALPAPIPFDPSQPESDRNRSPGSGTRQPEVLDNNRLLGLAPGPTTLATYAPPNAPLAPAPSKPVEVLPAMVIVGTRPRPSATPAAPGASPPMPPSLVGEASRRQNITRRVYEIMAGDTPSKIATRAGASDWRDLKIANPHKTPGPLGFQTFFAGELINIPDAWPDRTGMYRMPAAGVGPAPTPTAVPMAPLRALAPPAPPARDVVSAPADLVERRAPLPIAPAPMPPMGTRVPISGTVDPGVVKRIQTDLAVWARAYPANAKPRDYGKQFPTSPDTTGVMNARTQQCLAYFGKWANDSRFGAQRAAAGLAPVREDGIMDPPLVQALDFFVQTLLNRGEHPTDQDIAAWMQMHPPVRRARRLESPPGPVPQIRVLTPPDAPPGTPPIPVRVSRPAPPPSAPPFLPSGPRGPSPRRPRVPAPAPVVPTPEVPVQKPPAPLLVEQDQEDKSDGALPILVAGLSLAASFFL